MKALQWLNKYAALILGGLLVIAILFILRSNSNNKALHEQISALKQTESIFQGNLKVANDTIAYWKDENGKSMSEIKILTATSEMLKKDYSGLNEKYKNLVGKQAKDGEMIAYLNAQIEAKDRIIEDLKSGNSGSGSYVLNDSTVVIDVGKKYDSLNFYSVKGNVVTSIKNNKIVAGSIDLTTSVSLGLELGIARDKKTGIANITSRTAFPAKVNLSGITKIETELNKKPVGYLGIGIIGGYCATLEKTPQLKPVIGLGISYMPRWTTIKIHNR